MLPNAHGCSWPCAAETQHGERSNTHVLEHALKWGRGYTPAPVWVAPPGGAIGACSDSGSAGAAQRRETADTPITAACNRINRVAAGCSDGGIGLAAAAGAVRLWRFRLQRGAAGAAPAPAVPSTSQLGACGWRLGGRQCASAPVGNSGSVATHRTRGEPACRGTLFGQEAHWVHLAERPVEAARRRVITQWAREPPPTQCTGVLVP